MDVIEEVIAYGDLAEGWDGARAARPSAASISDAVAYLRAAPEDGAPSPSLHVAGDVLLDHDEGASMRFLGNGRVAFVLPDGRRGVVPVAALTELGTAAPKAP